MDTESIKSSLELCFNQIRIPNDDNIYFLKNTIKIKANGLDDKFIPYDLNAKTFKKKFLFELKLILNLDLTRLRNTSTEKKVLMGRSNIYDLLNYNLPNQDSKNKFWKTIFYAIKYFLQSYNGSNYNGWHCGIWKDKQKGLFKFIKENRDIFGGHIVQQGKEYKWESKDFFDDDRFYIYFNKLLVNNEEISLVKVKLFPDEDVGTDFREGDVKHVCVDRYERDSRAREKCIEYHGYVCKICGMDFRNVYGEIGKDFIHVHHKIPLEKIKERYGNIEYKVNPKNDLIPICPNCHAMIHKLCSIGDEAVEELKNILKFNKIDRYTQK